MNDKLIQQLSVRLACDSFKSYSEYGERDVGIGRSFHWRGVLIRGGHAGEEVCIGPVSVQISVVWVWNYLSHCIRH